MHVRVRPSHSPRSKSLLVIPRKWGTPSALILCIQYPHRCVSHLQTLFSSLPLIPASSRHFNIQTSSPDFKKNIFSVLRRYSDFLWLYEALISNNPGVVVPPVPEKVSFGRFEGSFVESRRLALNKCIQKIANHPRLCRDSDLKLFLESDSFALDVRI